MDCTQDLHHQQQLEQQESEARNFFPGYCDRFAHAIKTALNSHDPEGIIAGCGPVKMDLHPIDGYLVSTKKTMYAVDMNGRHYKITVEEI